MKDMKESNSLLSTSVSLLMSLPLFVVIYGRRAGIKMFEKEYGNVFS